MIRRDHGLVRDSAMLAVGVRWRVLSSGLVVALAIVLVCAPGALGASQRDRSRPLNPNDAPAPVPAIGVSLQASPALSVSGDRVILLGRATGVPAGSLVQLYSIAYPYSAVLPAGTAVTDEDGSFAFAVFPELNTRYRVTVAGGSAASALVQVGVTGKVLTSVKALSLGRARVTVVVFHSSDLRWGDARTSWRFASGYRGGLALAPGTHTVRLSRYVTVLSTTVTLPAGHFRWRACFHAQGDHALENPERPPGCTGRGYHGGGYLPIGFPGPRAVARAARYLSGRIGHTALAVVDSEGRLSGVNLHRTFITGSVVKAMLLVAYLRRLGAMGRQSVDSSSNSLLYPMIHVSDNDAATRCWSIVGNAGLYSVAAAAGMTDFSVTTDWASAMISAADQAKFFFDMDSLIPREFVGYAHHLSRRSPPTRAGGSRRSHARSATRCSSRAAGAPART